MVFVVLVHLKTICYLFKFELFLVRAVANHEVLVQWYGSAGWLNISYIFNSYRRICDSLVLPVRLAYRSRDSSPYNIQDISSSILLEDILYIQLWRICYSSIWRIYYSSIWSIFQISSIIHIYHDTMQRMHVIIYFIPTKQLHNL